MKINENHYLLIYLAVGNISPSRHNYTNTSES